MKASPWEWNYWANNILNLIHQNIKSWWGFDLIVSSITTPSSQTKNANLQLLDYFHFALIFPQLLQLFVFGNLLFLPTLSNIIMHLPLETS